MFTQPIKIVMPAAWVAAAAVGTCTAGIASIANADPPESVEQLLVGVWLGPSLAGIGQCDPAVGEFRFAADGTYSYQNTSENCAAFANAGNYAAQGNVLELTVEQCAPAATCVPGSQMNFAITVIDPNDIVLDTRFTYHRQ